MNQVGAAPGIRTASPMSVAGNAAILSIALEVTHNGQRLAGCIGDKGIESLDGRAVQVGRG